MKVNRTRHPFLSKEEMKEFVESLTPMELDMFTEVLGDEYEKNNIVAKDAFKKITEIKTLADSIKLSLRTAQHELESLEEDSTKLTTLLSGKEKPKPDGKV